MKNHFIISYAGNKRNEVEDILKLCDFNNITTIIEPFCGTCAVSYYISLKYPKKFKYILNDNNNHLIELMKTIKDEELYKNFKKKVNETINKIKDDKEEYKKIIKVNDLLGWFIANKYFTIRAGLFMTDRVWQTLTDDYPIINFLRTENIEFKNDNGTNILDQYKNDEKNFIFIDPPYLNSHNHFYESPDSNIYEYIYNNNINNYSCLVVCALENNWIIKLLFKDNINKTSTIIKNKIYQGSKKATTHIYFNNKN